MTTTIPFRPPFSGGVALVTGGAAGIGEALVAALAQQSLTRLVVIDRDAAALEALRARVSGPDLEIMALSHDVADEDAWAASVAQIKARFGGVDYVVANAGVGMVEPLMETTLAMWRRVMSVNLDGAFLTLKHGLELVRARGRGGAMVVVASAAGVRPGAGVAYGASKAAVIHLARAVGKQCAAEGIRVNAIAPGGVETPIWVAASEQLTRLKADLGDEGFYRYLANDLTATPSGRFAKPAEIADQILFLLSDLGANITGTALVSDGGYTV
jgi:2-keto-3-deoxy-L-fuconate dehydrogenase